jgi:hypothetical protein
LAEGGRKNLKEITFLVFLFLFLLPNQIQLGKMMKIIETFFFSGGRTGSGAGEKEEEKNGATERYWNCRRQLFLRFFRKSGQELLARRSVLDPQQQHTRWQLCAAVPSNENFYIKPFPAKSIESLLLLAGASPKCRPIL